MAEENENPEEIEGEDVDLGDDFEDEGGKRKSKKKLILIALPVLLLAVGGGLFATGMLDPLLGKEKNPEDAAEEVAETKEPAVYYELPQMLVNLNSPGRRSNFLKIIVSLELAEAKDVETLEAAMPRIIDNFQVYLRELRVEDLRGSAGIYRLREELLFRVNSAVRPARVTDVLFKEMLVQ
ncbi:MAG: flagellar basal body-associated FliL family protein [Alphaproteobacteria bacterium]|nr:flagellar basal body-associated FliL family protein [Alphaproteobacteria bacterium]